MVIEVTIMAKEVVEYFAQSYDGPPPAYQKTDKNGFRIYPQDTSMPPDPEKWMTPEQLARFGGPKIDSGSSDETSPDGTADIIPT
jgi:hypothetical protein